MMRTTTTTVSAPVAVRGLALADRVISALRRKKVAHPPGLPATEVAGMRLANGAPIPDSLRKLLLVHGPAEQFPGRWNADAKHGALEGVSFETLLRRHYDDEALAYFDVRPLIEGLPGMCHPLEDDTPLRFVYVGTPDPWGEYPVLTLQDYDDCLEVVVDFPGLDVYFACRTGVLPKPTYYGGIGEHEAYGPMLRETVAANFPNVTKRKRQYLFAARYLEIDES